MANLYNVPLKNAVQKVLQNTLTSGETATITFTTSVTTDLQASSSIPGILVVDRIDVNGNLTPALTEYISFTAVSGSTVTGLTRALGGTTAQDHAIGAIVEFVPDVVWADALNDVITTQHNADGTHKTLSAISLASVTIQNSVIIGASLASVTISNFTLSGGIASVAITNSSLDAFTFNSGFSNMSNATQGNLIAFNQGVVRPITNGTVNQTLLIASTASGLLPTFGSNVFNQFERYGGNASVYPSAGSTAYTETSVFMQMGAVDCVGLNTNGGTKAITFPKAFTQVPMVFLQFYDVQSANWGVIGNTRSISTTGFTIINNSAINANNVYYWLAIGK